MILRPWLAFRSKRNLERANEKNDVTAQIFRFFYYDYDLSRRSHPTSPVPPPSTLTYLPSHQNEPRSLFNNHVHNSFFTLERRLRINIVPCKTRRQNIGHFVRGRLAAFVFDLRWSRIWAASS